MRLTRLRTDCPDTETCPTLYQTNRGTAVIRGYVVTDLEALGVPSLLAGETAVEVPFALLAGLTISGRTLQPTERGTVLVRGKAITDAEALVALHLPLGEAAVEIPLSLLTNLVRQETPT